MKLLIYLIFASHAFNQGRVSLLEPEEPKKQEAKTIEVVETKAPLPAIKRTSKNQNINKGNLPGYYSDLSSRPISSKSESILPSSKVLLGLPGILIGDLLQAEIQESAIAFSDSKAPIRAIVTSSKLKGALLLGEASLEKNSKRILIRFNKIRKPRSEESYPLSASALDEAGILGLKGELITGESTYFAAEFLAAGAAGFADSTVERNQNNLGNYVDEPSLSNATKKAFASSLMRTADRFAEKLKSVPEYSILNGPIAIQVLIEDEGRTQN
jgi:hypothetical protein